MREEPYVTLLVIDLEDRNELRREQASSASLSWKMAALMQDDGEGSQYAYKYKVRLISTADGSEIERADGLEADWCNGCTSTTLPTAYFWISFAPGASGIRICGAAVAMGPPRRPRA